MQAGAAGVAPALTLLFTLNLFDAASTLYLLGFGAEEGNPLMRALLDLGPLWFVGFKVVGIGVACYGLWSVREHALARWGIYGLTGFYVLLACWHLYLLHLVW